MLVCSEVQNDVKKAIMPETINFYSTQGIYGCFSNFSRFPVTYADVSWKTSEHAYQAQKFLGTSIEQWNAIRICSSPRMAAAFGRDLNQKIRADWDDVRVDVMRAIVTAKFTGNADLKKILLDTGDAILVEHTVNDSFWADGGDGSGQNMLGKILMEVRDRIRNAA